MNAFDREALGALFEDLQRGWPGTHQLDRLIRDAHLTIALHDANRPLGQDIDPWVAALIHRHSSSD